MIRVRFHGRGGHGVKTASRILGTGAFLGGHQVQDSPVYGAERRGAPVTAFTRIDDTPIFERGAIVAPDLIIVADPTLLEDEAAHVLDGQDTASCIFVNAASDEGLATGIDQYLVTLDLSAPTLKVLGRASALSAGIGAAAARLTGCVSEANLVDGVRDELGQLGLAADVIAKNVKIAREVFAAVPVVKMRQVSGHILAPAFPHTVSYDPPTTGAPSILADGNTALRKTGAWRVEIPEIDRSRCIRCGLCFVRCPDGAIALDEDGFPVIDYDHCKGCMICRQICPVEKGIVSHKETEAW